MSGTPSRVWDNRDRFFEPTGTTRASIVGATRPPVGYYLEFPKHLVGFADSVRRLFFGSLEFGDGACVRQVNFDTVGERRFLKVGGKWARSQNGSSDSFQRKNSEWGTEVLQGRRVVGTKPKWLERFLSTKK